MATPEKLADYELANVVSALCDYHKMPRALREPIVEAVSGFIGQPKTDHIFLKLTETINDLIDIEEERKEHGNP